MILFKLTFKIKIYSNLFKKLKIQVGILVKMILRNLDKCPLHNESQIVILGEQNNSLEK